MRACETCVLLWLAWTLGIRDADVLMMRRNEALRLVPAIASGSQRSVPPGSGGTTVGP